MTLGKRLTSLRVERGYTQEELAKMLGITRASLSHYENDRREADYETLKKMAECFDVSIDYLLGRTNNPHTVLDQEVREFVDSLELSEEAILETFTLTVDGVKLTPQEAKRFIAFVRAERAMQQ
jgi:transcriptional regulator with XRE-family HTH domain